jgi:hypothetical protein
MSIHIDATNSIKLSDPPAVKLDRSQWTDRQYIQYKAGLWDGIEGHPARVRELPEWNWVPNDEWRQLRGILSDHPDHDTTKMKADNRAEEEEHDARKFGRSRD